MWRTERPKNKGGEPLVSVHRESRERENAEEESTVGNENIFKMAAQRKYSVELKKREVVLPESRAVKNPVKLQTDAKEGSQKAG